MARHECLRGLTLLGAFGALGSASPLAADHGKPAAAGTPPFVTPAAGTPEVPKITDVLFLELAEVPRAVTPTPDSEKPLTSAIQKMRFRLAIKGQHLPCTTIPDVLLETQDPGQPVEDQIVNSCSEEQIDVSGVARVGAVIKSVRVATGGCKETPTLHGKAASSSGMVSITGDTVTITDHATTNSGVAPILTGKMTITGTAAETGATAIITDHATTISGDTVAVTGEQATITGNNATISIARTAQNNGKCTPPAKGSTGKSDCNAATSTGLTISIKPSSPQSMLQEFGVKFAHQRSKEFPNLHSLLVTKLSGDALVGFAANPNHMSVDLEPTGATELRVVQSNEEQLELHFVAGPDYVPANVVITVYNSSNLDTRRPLYVAKAAETSKTSGTDANAPAITSVETVFLDRHEGNGRIRIYGKGFGKEFSVPPYPVDDFLCDCLERPPLALPEWERFQTCGTLSKDLGALWLDKKPKDRDKKKEVARRGLESHRRAYCGVEGQFTWEIIPGGRLDEWMKWQCAVSLAGINVGLSSRNADIRVEKAEIININDTMIDVYFEFNRHYSYAWPFRLAGVDLTIPVKAKKVEQVVTVPSAKTIGEVDAATQTMVHLSSPIDGKIDKELTYKYTVLSYHEVQQLLGDGVADNFNVVELAVVNNHSKKVAIPLAGMQAEIEWLYGRNVKPPAEGFFLEGPPTLPPVPMSTVSAYFGASKKKTERRVMVFNVLEGITTFVGALIPFAGIGLKDAEVVFSSGFIPGLQHVWVDISDQQLQNLTALSWQTSETLAANGGSMQKLIYIQRGEQFKSALQDTAVPPKVTLQQMADIMGLEVTGYEIHDSPAIQATPGGKSSTAADKTKASTSSTSASDATGTTTSETTAPP
jgi:hypothetical protein